MIGILAEKPSAARNMSAALGGMSGTYNGEQYVIAAARGHLFEFDDPEKQVPPALKDQLHSWNLDYLPWDETQFKWKYIKKKDAADTLKTIHSILCKCDEIVIATDDDPTGEGTLLAVEILDELKLVPKKFSRMFFADESSKELQKAFVNRKPMPQDAHDMDYVKAFYRTRWDFLSMQFTRIATKCGDGKSVLRQGRLKSAMVKLVGDQLAAVAAYKKIPYYENRFKDENGVVYSDPDEPRFEKKEDVPQKYSQAHVVCDKKEMKKTAPPKMLDLAGLSSRLVSVANAKTILATYQKMYEKQIVSYPRTEDKFITPEQFNDLLPLVDQIAAVVGVDSKLLTHRTPRSTHVKTGGAHGANRPGVNVPKSLADLDQYGPGAKEIYVLLAKNYLATLAEDYEYESQIGHLQEYPTFKGSAQIPKFAGWKAVYDADDDKDETENPKGLGTLADPYVHEGFPPKPATPTMKWLMKQLEKYDVGTGATRTSTYAEVTSTGGKFPLMKDSKGKISFTEFGNMSYKMLPGTNIGSLEKTAELMQEMRDIADGKKNPEECLKAIRQMVIDDMAVMKKNGEAMRKELGIVDTSGVQKEKFKGMWNGKEVTVSRIWGGHRFTDEEIEKLLDGEEIEIECEKKDGSGTYGVKGNLADLEYNGKSYVGFNKTGFAGDGQASDAERWSGTWNGKDVRFKRDWGGHHFTDEECERLCKGEEIEIECQKKDGSGSYTAKGVLADLEYNGHKYVGFNKTGFGGGNGQGGQGGIPKSFCKHEFTDDERTALSAGLVIERSDWVSKKGSTFSAKIRYGRKDDGSIGIVFVND